MSKYVSDPEHKPPKKKVPETEEKCICGQPKSKCDCADRVTLVDNLRKGDCDA